MRLALGARTAVLLSGILPTALLAGVSLQVFDNREVRTLIVLTRAMFPHNELDDIYYVDVVRKLDENAASSAEFLRVIRTGIAALDEAVSGTWVDATVDDKLQTLEALQTESFFAAILNQTIDVLYRNQEVLTMLGYQGSSIEYGGYLHRGFDDIGWLPR